MTAHRTTRYRVSKDAWQFLAAAIPAAGMPASAPLDLFVDDHTEPPVEELEAIEADWPTYAAFLAVVEAECRFAISPNALARRALRRAEAHLARTLATRANTSACSVPFSVPQGAIS